MNPLRLATRKSRLALWQAEHVRSLLLDAHPNLSVELVEVLSSGDVDRSRPLHEMETIGIFTKEIQDAVLDGRADVAVHSLKDLPTVPHPGLILAGVPERGPTGDVLVAPVHRTLDALPKGAKIATSSLRRRAQLLRHRTDLTLVDIRGNVETRLRLLEERGLDGLVLAEAGLVRLGLKSTITERIAETVLLPAVGQGALGIECRADDDETASLLLPLNHDETRQRVEAERAFLHAIQGGCQVPVGAITHLDDNQLRLRAVVLNTDGREYLELEETGDASQSSSIGLRLAEAFLRQGAGRWIRTGLDCTR